MVCPNFSAISFTMNFFKLSHMPISTFHHGLFRTCSVITECDGTLSITILFLVNRAKNLFKPLFEHITIHFSMIIPTFLLDSNTSKSPSKTHVHYQYEVIGLSDTCLCYMEVDRPERKACRDFTSHETMSRHV